MVTLILYREKEGDFQKKCNLLKINDYYRIPSRDSEKEKPEFYQKVKFLLVKLHPFLFFFKLPPPS